jgi:hypothetical protein
MKKVRYLIILLVVILLLIFTNQMVFAWGESSTDASLNTHKFISNQALVILNNDEEHLIIGKSSEIKNSIKELLKYKNSFIEYSTYPDKHENCELTFVGHFYDPDTKMNYAGDQKYTALNGFEYHALVAKKLYTNKGIITDEVAKELGKAAHYLEDMSEPHHASNNIANAHISTELLMALVKNCEKPIPSFVVTDEEKEAFEATFGRFTIKENKFIGNVSNHYAFETWAADNQGAVDEYGNKKYEVDTSKDKFFIQRLYIPYKKYLTGDLMKDLNSLGVDSAVFAKKTIQTALSPKEEDWAENISTTLPMSQMEVAEFLYTFLKEAVLNG